MLNGPCGSASLHPGKEPRRPSIPGRNTVPGRRFLAGLAQPSREDQVPGMRPEQVIAAIFGLNLVSYTLLLRWWIWPRVTALALEDGLAPLVAFHLIRTLGMFALVPGMSGEHAASSTWAHHVAIGDAVAVVLAMLAVSLLRARHALAIPSVWVFNSWGFLDCLNAGRNAAAEGILLHDPQAQSLVIGFGVPALLVTHVAIFVLLLRGRRV
jgi:hypothetical protein